MVDLTGKEVCRPLISYYSRRKGASKGGEREGRGEAGGQTRTILHVADDDASAEHRSRKPLSDFLSAGGREGWRWW